MDANNLNKQLNTWIKSVHIEQRTHKRFLTCQQQQDGENRNNFKTTFLTFSKVVDNSGEEKCHSWLKI